MKCCKFDTVIYAEPLGICMVSGSKSRSKTGILDKCDIYFSRTIDVSAVSGICNSLKRRTCCVFWPRCMCHPGTNIDKIKVYLDSSFFSKVNDLDPDTNFEYGVKYGILQQAFQGFKLFTKHRRIKIPSKPSSWTPDTVPNAAACCTKKQLCNLYGINTDNIFHANDINNSLQKPVKRLSKHACDLIAATIKCWM